MHIQKYKVIVKIILGFFDMVLINMGYIIAFLIKFGWNIPQENFIAYLSTWPYLTLSAFALFYFYRLYGSYRWRWAEVLASLICVIFFQAMAAMALSFLFRGFSFPRTVMLTAPFIQLALLALWRRATWHIERGLQETRRVIVVGQPLEAVVLAEKLESIAGGIIKVSGLVIDTTSDKGVRELDHLETEEINYESVCDILGHWPVLGEVPEFCECLDAVGPDQVFLCSTLSQEDKAEVVYACVARDKKVFLVPDLYEIMLAQARLEQVDDVPVFTVGRLTQV